MKLYFASDYQEGALPEIVDALVESNMIPSPGYGSDDYFCTTVIGGRNPMCEGVFMRPTATYWQLHDVCASLSKGDFRAFSFVGDNIYRQCSEFSTGKVWANVSTNSRCIMGSPP